jgi:nucleoside-diphosphate-sugar epimerase
MKVLITGATGFLGSRLVAALAARGHSVRALSRGGESRLPTASVEIVRGDMKDKDSLRRAMAGVDAVCYGAAAMKGPWREYEQTTVRGTEWLLELALGEKVKRFVHLSSITAYKTTGLERGTLIDESFPLDPNPEQRGPYPQAKIAAERHVGRSLQLGLPAVVIRPGIVFGPGGRMMHPNVGYFLTKKCFLLIGRGDNPLPLTYVDNTVEGIALALDNDQAVGQAYNLIDDSTVTQREWLDRYREAFGKRFAVFSLPLPLILAGAALASRLRPFGIPAIDTPAYGFRSQYANVRFDAAKARRELGWRPRVGLEEGLRRMFFPSVSEA